jgi:hypothetical protein
MEVSESTKLAAKKKFAKGTNSTEEPNPPRVPIISQASANRKNRAAPMNF